MECCCLTELDCSCPNTCIYTCSTFTKYYNGHTSHTTNYKAILDILSASCHRTVVQSCEKEQELTRLLTSAMSYLHIASSSCSCLCLHWHLVHLLWAPETLWAVLVPSETETPWLGLFQQALFVQKGVFRCTGGHHMWEQWNYTVKTIDWLWRHGVHVHI